MTEKEKMLCGKYYDTRDLALRRLSSNAKDLMRVYNSLPAENMDLRNQIIHLLFGSCGENVRVNQPVWVDYGCNISLGANSLINMNCTLLDTGRITIGNNTLIGPDVKIRQQRAFIQTKPAKRPSARKPPLSQSETMSGLAAEPSFCQA